MQHVYNLNSGPEISILSLIGRSIPRLARQGYQAVILAKDPQSVVQHGRDVNSRLDFNFEQNRANCSKVSMSGLPDCDVGQKSSKE